MKKAVVASLLAVASAAPGARFGFAQQQVNLGSGQQNGNNNGQVQMPQAEYNDYTAAINQTTPQTKAPALEAYLQKYPNSSVKTDVLTQMMVAYSSFDPAKTLDAADRLLQVDPNNLRAITLEVYFRKASADQLTDATAKQAALDKAAEYAQKGLAATKPTDMKDEDFKTLTTNAYPIFYSAIATAALNKKDTATAIDNYKKELAAVPADQTTKPGPILQDTYYLGLAYLQSTPPDYLDCAFYVDRFTVYAPEPYKSQMVPTAQYCYKKYHGNADGYDKVTTAATSNVTPPADYSTSITPAPKPSDIAHQTVASTPDLGTLALSDKEFILQNGTPDDAEKVWATVKGKTVEIPDATVITATADTITAAVSDDAVQSKQADFTFNMKEPLKTIPTVGSKVTLTGTYSSYTQGGQAAASSTTSASATAAPAAPVSPSTPAGATSNPSSTPSTASAPTNTSSTTPDTNSTATTTAQNSTASVNQSTTATTNNTPAPGQTGPLMIVMSDGAVTTKAAPARRTTPARRPATRR